MVSPKLDSHLDILGNSGPNRLIAWNLRVLFLCLWCAVATGTSSPQVASATSSSSSGDFTLSGTVVNSVTGEPIGRALVRIIGVVQRTVFSDGEGRFQIDGLPTGSVNVEAQKPGYFSQQQLRSGGINDLVNIGPDTARVVVKLTPQSAIYGRITDAAGQPIENVPVRLTERSVRDGRRRWDARSLTQSDEDGRFRFANLLPGTYYLAAGPGSDETRFRAHDEKPKTGYPSLYYPAAPDLSSASPIQLDPGQQTEADLSMPVVPVYQISGMVIGYPAGQGVGLQLLTQSGQALSLPVRFAMDTGVFEAFLVPAGSYVLTASSQAGDQPLRAEIRLNVATNLDNVHLTMGPALSIPIAVRMESRDPSHLSSPGWNQQRPPVSVRLIPTEQLTPERSSTFLQQSPGREIMALPDVEPGKYVAEAMAWGPWYVQSAQYGPTNLLTDDLTIIPGQAYPLEIVLRDDDATLSGNFKASEQSGRSATVLVLPQPASNRGVKVIPLSPQSGFTVNGLAPGDYLVFAFDRVDNLEYANPDVLQPYVSQATHVTLAPNQETRVVLNLIRTGNGE